MPRKKIKMVEVDLSCFPECPEGQSLQDAQQDVVDCLEMGDGCDCPLCGRVVKAYHRKLAPVIVARLIVLVGRYLESKDWGPVPDIPAGRNPQFMNLEYWDFITVAEDAEGETVVKPTREGYDFIRGKATAPSHIFFFNNKRIGISENQVSVEEALEGKYDYLELMQDVPIPTRKLKVKD